MRLKASRGPSAQCSWCQAFPRLPREAGAHTRPCIAGSGLRGHSIGRTFQSSSLYPAALRQSESSDAALSTSTGVEKLLVAVFATPPSRSRAIVGAICRDMPVAAAPTACRRVWTRANVGLWSYHHSIYHPSRVVMTGAGSSALTVAGIGCSTSSVHGFGDIAAASTAPRKVLMTASGSRAPKMALPATMTFAPASAACSMVAGDSPPSTCALPARGDLWVQG